MSDRIELTSEQIAHVFGLGEPTGPLAPLAGNSGHRTWRLDVGGDAYFVKQYSRPPELPIWSEWKRSIEGSWEIERSAAAAGLPVAEAVVAAGAVWPWLDMEVGGHSETIRVHRWVPGRLRTDPVSVAAATQLGTFLGRLHQLLPTVDQWRRRPTWPTEWNGVPNGDGSDETWRRSLRRALPVLEVASEHCAKAAAEVRPLVQSHRDLHSHNVIERPDGQLVVVDWDAASTQRPDWELVETALELAGYLKGAPSRPVVEAFVAAYRLTGASVEPITESSFAGLLMCSLNWLDINLRRMAGRPPGGEHREGASASEAKASLMAVERIAASTAHWLEWFA